MPIRKHISACIFLIHFQCFRNFISFNKSHKKQKIMIKQSRFAATKRMTIDYKEFCLCAATRGERVFCADGDVRHAQNACRAAGGPTY